MSVQRVGIVIGVVLVLFVGWVGTGFVGARADEKDAAGSEFAGKYLIVSHHDTAAYLEKVQVKKLGDKHFLVGTWADTEVKDDWQKGRPVWVPLDAVSEITVFPSQAELAKAIKTFPKPAEKK
jgi:hypothetical protein